MRRPKKLSSVPHGNFKKGKSSRKRSKNAGNPSAPGNQRYNRLTKTVPSLKHEAAREAQSKEVNRDRKGGANLRRLNVMKPNKDHIGQAKSLELLPQNEGYKKRRPRNRKEKARQTKGGKKTGIIAVLGGN